MDLTPRQIVAELDLHIVGQADAKRMVAIALRNRLRRSQVPQPMRDEIMPKNILMIGPTGVGKTEIARRLSKLARAPFIKVEATKYTEVGYVGRDVESMVRDLVEMGVNMARDEMAEEIRPLAEEAVNERLLDLLLPPPPGYRQFVQEQISEPNADDVESIVPDEANSKQVRLAKYHRTRGKFRRQLLDGKLENRKVEIDLPERTTQVAAIFPGGGGDEATMNLQEMFDKMMPSRSKRREMTVAEARPRLFEQECQRLIDHDQAVQIGLERAQQSGIIFIDEIDKIAGRSSETRGPDVSREGVQRDILPIVEGCAVFTKHGVVHTDHILFIGSGAFHASKPSDLIPELQGRFPLRAQLKALTADDFRRILVEPQGALTKQSEALMATEGIKLSFTDDGIDEIAITAERVNTETEQIGARRLQTLMEKIVEDLAFESPECGAKKVVIDRAFVRERLADITGREDLSRFIL